MLAGWKWRAYDSRIVSWADVLNQTTAGKTPQTDGVWVQTMIVQNNQFAAFINSPQVRTKFQWETQYTNVANLIVRFDGFLHVPRAGTWDFYSDSDDGSTVWIDVNRNEKEDSGETFSNGAWVSLSLQNAKHKTRYMWQEGGGGDRFTLWWRGPNNPQETIPGKNLFYLP
jgi:hypothetical protein